ncbi:uncharacterized protein [Eurosta solidaginis]|uniref:uncharacterized protein n=1 Tax=Eurosta solidaginis TaxID=178769 RepID=UPI003530B2CE
MLGATTVLSTSENASMEHTNLTNSILLQSTTSFDTRTNTEKITSEMDIEPENSGHFILIPFVALLLIMALSALVFLIRRNRRRLGKNYCPRSSGRKCLFEDDSDSPLEQGDGYDFDDPSECLLKSKLQIDSSYDSTQRKELYT